MNAKQGRRLVRLRRETYCRFAEDLRMMLMIYLGRLTLREDYTAQALAGYKITLINDLDPLPVGD